MYTGEQLQGHNQQPENGNSQLLTVQCSYFITPSSVCIVTLFIYEYSFGSCHHNAIPTADNKLVSIAWDFRGPLLPSSGYGASIDHGESSSSIPWDPGGVAWWRLEGKLPFKDGGMLTATLPFTVGPVHRWARWHWVGLGQRAWRRRAIKIRENNREGGLDLDGFGLLSLRSSSFSRVPPLIL
jgi:hypothetical protein